MQGFFLLFYNRETNAYIYYYAYSLHIEYRQGIAVNGTRPIRAIQIYEANLKSDNISRLSTRVYNIRRYLPPMSLPR